VYAQFFAVLMIAAHGASLLLRARRHEIAWRDFARCLRWVGLMILPIAVVILRIGNTSAAWIGVLSVRGLFEAAKSIAGNGGVALVLFEAIGLLAAGLAAVRAWRPGGMGQRSWGYALVLAWLFVPPGIVLAVSVMRPIFVPRYLFFCLPALLLCVAAGVAGLRHTPVALALCAILTILSVQGSLSYYRNDFDIYREDWRAATAYILGHSQAEDGIFFGTFGRMPYEYYKSQQSSSAGPQTVNWPGATTLDPRDFTVRPVAELLRDARPAPDRIWLVLFLDHTSTGQVNPTSVMLRAWYGKGRQLVTEQEFSQISVFLFARNAASSFASPAAKRVDAMATVRGPQRPAGISP
jgi:hypothetical protein